MMFDPLKILYLLILETDNIDEVTVFQGFSRSWHYLHWALSLLPYLPADIIESSQDLTGVNAQRVNGSRLLQWSPISRKIYN
jgi:hypothetical protein